MNAKSKNDVVHHGMPGHFIGAPECCFHLHSTVRSKWRVSTVGCYHPTSQRKGDCIGDAVPVGGNRLYETMVFKILDGEVNYMDVDFAPYNSEREAEVGHAAMVEKYRVTP